MANTAILGTTGRPLVALAVGFSVSTYGTYLNLVALSLFTYRITGNAVGTGEVMALRLAAGFAAGTVAGRLAARTDRRRLMIGTDLAQALAMVALVLWANPVTLVAATVVLGAGASLFTVALRTSVVGIVGEANALRANGYLVTAKSLATVLGLASAAPLVSIGGYEAAFLINAGSFLFSTATLLRLPADRGWRSSAEPGSGPGRLRMLSAPLLAMILLRGADTFGSGSHNVALPVFATLVDPADPAGYMSRFMASWAVGSLVTYRVVSRVIKRRPGALGGRAFAVGTCAMSAAFVLSFTGPPPVLLTVVGLVAGFADGFTEIAYTTRLQAAPEAARAYLFGLSSSVETAGLGGGLLASSALLQRLPALEVVAIFHAVPVAGAGAFLLAGLVRSRSGR
ncbi:MFS transporter [Kutzneria chonburiensis]|uniref:MFS transporter n=1 Tax=Kutzneria chonburiensis TaxID=1483604 RepID=A0ABV6MQJ4_9PSEU|nr:MFS transporter [Kutzneria chonburiensis]